MIRSRMLSLMVLLLIGLPALAAAQNGTVTGTVTSAATAAPLAGRSLVFCTAVSSGTSCSTSANTDASGNYSISLAPGSYVAYTSNFHTLGFINEIYDNISCPGICSSSTALTSGAAVVVTSGATATGKNFALDIGGSVTGTVTDTTTGLPVQSAVVTLRTLVGTTNFQAGSATTNAAGTYSVLGLPTGVYYAYTNSSSVGYTSEIFDNLLCPGPCTNATAVNSGAPIAVTTGATTNNVNFLLDPGARITGIVLNQTTSAPMQGVIVQAYTRIGLTAMFAGSASTNASGVYSIGGLPAGTYALATATNLAINEIYNNLPCSGSCSSSTAVATGEAVAVARGATASGKDFQLDPGGAVSGTVTDALSSAPLSNAFVQVYRQVGASAVVVASGSSNSSGVYTVGGLPTGSYFALASPSSSANIPEVFGGPSCAFCDTAQILSGTAIAVTVGATTPGRDFALDAGATLTGTVTSSTTSAPLANVTVFLVVSGNLQVGFNTNAAGGFTMTGLPAGSYYVFTDARQHSNKAYNNVACPGGSCSAAFVTTNGAPIGLTGGVTTSGIDFALDPLQTAPGAPFSLTASANAGTASITWSPPTSGGVATSYILEAGLSPGTTLGTLPATAPALSLPGVPPGTFYLRVRAVNSFGTGPASAEFVLIVDGGGNTPSAPPTNLAAWMSDGRLTMTWTAPTGAAPTSYVIEAGSAVGLANLAVFEVTTRSFTFDPIPSGFFFLRVRSKSGAVVSAPTPDVMVNVGGVPAPPSPPQSFNVSRSGTTVTLSWTAPVLGTPTSYVVEAGTATGLANLGVLNTGTTATTLVVPGVPSGTFYLRVRAANAQGASPVSNERELTVP